MQNITTSILEMATECMQLADDRTDLITPAEYILLMELIIIQAQRRKAICEYNSRPTKGSIG